MRTGIVLSAAALVAVGAWAAVSLWWLVGFHLVWWGVWLVIVERLIGVGTFLRFDPWKPAAQRARRVRAALLVLLTLAGAAAVAAIGIAYPDPAAFIVLVDFLTAAYTRWAIGYIKSYGTDPEVAVEVHL